MNKITDSNLERACKYLQNRLDIRSWWPKAQPGQAKNEFKLMSGSAGALNVWCERWLDLGQLKKLEREIKN
ncbi:MAG: hypothetical protein ACKE51_02515 [Methylococcaceae bacterium]